MTDPATCDHPNFAVQADANRVAMPGPEGSIPRIGAYRLLVSCHCTDCNTPFWFPGLPSGVSFKEPVTSNDGFVVALPIVPAGQRNEPDPSLVSTIIRNNDIHKGRKVPS